MRILGIDPGYDIVGFGIIEKTKVGWEYLDGGIIKTDKDSDYWDRLEQIANDIDTLVSEFSPSVCSMEELYFSKNVTTGIKVAQARGVIGMKMRQYKLPIFSYSPSQVKSAVVGNGRAEKWEMQEMVRILLSLDQIPKPDDFADALAVALCHGVMDCGYGNVTC